MKNELGNKIKEWRKIKKLTQEEFAHRIGRSTEAVSMLERGVNHPAPDTIESISKVLGIPVHEFYKNSEEGNKSKRQQMIDKAVGILYNIDDRGLKVALRTLEALDEE